MLIGKIQRLTYPTGITVDIHSYCNAKCKMCPYPYLRDKNPMGFMSWKLYTKIVNDYSQLMKKFNFKGKMSYCQMGEPFILEDIAKWIKCAMDHGIDVYLNTNCSLLTPAILDSLIDIGFSGIFNISFHGITKDVYENIMGLNFDRTQRNIEYLLKKYPHHKIAVNAIPFKWPKGEREKMLAYWKSKGIEVTFSPALSRSGLVPDIRKTQRKRITGCSTERIFFEMVISFNGDVLLCCQDMAQEVVLGNLNNSTIYEVWNGKRFQSILEAIYTGVNLPPSFICRRCEESLPYWSWRRIIKSLLPDGLLREVRKRRDYGWIVTKKLN